MQHRRQRTVGRPRCFHLSEFTFDDHPLGEQTPDHISNITISVAQLRQRQTPTGHCGQMFDQLSLTRRTCHPNQGFVRIDGQRIARGPQGQRLGALAQAQWQSTGEHLTDSMVIVGGHPGQEVPMRIVQQRNRIEHTTGRAQTLRRHRAAIHSFDQHSNTPRRPERHFNPHARHAILGVDTGRRQIVEQTAMYRHGQGNAQQGGDHGRIVWEVLRNLPGLFGLFN